MNTQIILMTIIGIIAVLITLVLIAVTIILPVIHITNEKIMEESNGY